MSWRDFKPGRIACPHCGYDGTSHPLDDGHDHAPFFWLVDVTLASPVLAIAGKIDERGTVQTSEDVEMRGDERDPRLVCARCENAFPIPDGVLHESADEATVTWDDPPAEILCPTCHHLVTRNDANGRYVCAHCGHLHELRSTAASLAAENATAAKPGPCTTMRSYRVAWVIDIDAQDPKDAAGQAREIQMDAESLATVFDVREHGAQDPPVRVDLCTEEQEHTQRTVRCALCGRHVPVTTAHQHEGKWIGQDCCWDKTTK